MMQALFNAWVFSLAFGIAILAALAVSAAVWRAGYRAGLEDRADKIELDIERRLRDLDEQFSRLGLINTVRHIVSTLFE